MYPDLISWSAHAFLSASNMEPYPQPETAAAAAAGGVVSCRCGAAVSIALAMVTNQGATADSARGGSSNSRDGQSRNTRGAHPASFLKGLWCPEGGTNTQSMDHGPTELLEKLNDIEGVELRLKSPKNAGLAITAVVRTVNAIIRIGRRRTDQAQGLFGSPDQTGAEQLADQRKPRYGKACTAWQYAFAGWAYFLVNGFAPRRSAAGGRWPWVCRLV